MSDKIFGTQNDSTWFPEPIGKLIICEGFEVRLFVKMPCRFHRWMTRVLLGWKYEEYTEDEP